MAARLLESLLWANRRLDLHTRVTILTRDAQAFARKAPHLAAGPALEIVSGDVRSFSFPAGEFSHVIHAATDASAKLTEENPTLMFDTIVEGTRRVLEFAESARTQRMLFLSSGAVYGAQPPGMAWMAEEFAGEPQPLDATSDAYAKGKRTAELLCALSSRAGAEIKIARCFAFVGPYMKLDAHFAIGNFILDQMRGRSIRVNGDGRAVRSYMYASDLMVWLWTILFSGRPLHPYNVGSEDAVTIRELAECVAESLEPRVEVEVLGAPGTAPPHRYVPSTARARNELGLNCEVALPEAIRRTRQWFAMMEAENPR